MMTHVKVSALLSCIWSPSMLTLNTHVYVRGNTTDTKKTCKLKTPRHPGGLNPQPSRCDATLKLANTRTHKGVPLIAKYVVWL